MPRPEYLAIISDIDGTLTPIRENALPSQRVVSSIQRATELGISFSLATGRPFFLVKYLVDHLGNIGPSIVDNGAVITDRFGAVIWEANLSIDSANRILDLSRRFELVRASCNTGGIDNPRIIPPGSKVRKLSIHDIPIEQGEAIIASITKEFKDVEGVKAASYKGEPLIDVYFSDAQATKFHAVQRLAEILGISSKQMIGVGDGYNDYPMLEACGLKVAMGNAVEELKAIADVVAPSVSEDGLAKVIEDHILTHF
jgi:HAD superfamily hydrolase (TIGR01484 family)